MIERLPVIKYCTAMEKKARNFKLLEGYSAETSGGLLMAINPEDRDLFLSMGAWEIGKVVEGSK